MADLHPDRLAAELRDVLANLDNIRDTLNGLAADAVENSIVLGAIDSPALRAHAIAAVSVAAAGADASTRLRDIVRQLDRAEYAR